MKLQFTHEYCVQKDKEFNEWSRKWEIVTERVLWLKITADTQDKAEETMQALNEFLQLQGIHVDDYEVVTQNETSVTIEQGIEICNDEPKDDKQYILGAFDAFQNEMKGAKTK